MMLILKRYFLLLSVLVISLFSAVSAHADAPMCGKIFVREIKLRDLKDVERMRVMTYNLENFYYNVNKIATEGRAQEKYQDIAEIILDQRPEVLVLQEVHSKKSLEDFNYYELQDRYDVYVSSGNQSGGQNIAFMVKKDLNLKVEIKTNKDHEWFDPAQNELDYLFDRDFPAMILREGSNTNPALIVFGHHGKAMIDRPGDPKSTQLRTEQIKRITMILEDYGQVYGKETPILVAGDFNADVHRAKEVNSIKSIFNDVFEYSPIVRELFERYTHTYHPRNKPSEAHAMDAIFVNSTLKEAIKSARVFRYRDELGLIKPLPQTPDQRSENPSDHFPIIVDIDVQPLIRVSP